MLSISQISSAGSALSYYQSDNYYAKDSTEGKGFWYGGVSHELNLNDKEVKPEEFVKILEGDLPNGQSVYAGGKNSERKHIPGYDLTFSAPKSVSIMAIYFGNDKYKIAHDNAVKKTLDYAEKHILQTRISNKETKKQDNVGNQKMLSALFTHDISRNGEPQLHTHCVLANITLGEDGKYRSVHSPTLFRNKMLLGMIYRAELAKEIHNTLGTVVKTHADGFFELKGVPKALSEAFSTRAKEIKESLGDGKHTAIEKARAALATRKAKQELDRKDLKEKWSETVKDLGFSNDKILADTRYVFSLFSDDKVIREAEAQEISLEHLSEKSSTFLRRDLYKQMLSEGVGNIVIDGVEKHVSESIAKGEILTSIDGNTLYTPETLKREVTTLELEKDGRGAVDPIMARNKVRKEHNGSSLTKMQFEASKHILSSCNRTVGIQGYAGTGKTFMLASVSAQLKERGYTVLGLAPTSEATRLLGGEAEIRSQTVQKYLINPSGNHKTVLLVDESGLMGTQQMMDLLSHANQNTLAKVVLIGDSKQLEGASSGAPFRMLQAEGMSTVVMDEIKRQKKDRHLEAVKSASVGDIDRAFKNLGDDIREVALEKLAEKTAKAWLESPIRDKAAVIVTTNNLANSVNAHIKSSLIAEGSISNNGFELTALKSLNLSEVQRKYANNYHFADFVRFNRGYTKLGIMAGDTLAIKDVKDNGSILLTRNDKTIEFRPHTHATGKGAVEAFAAEPMSLNEGDKVRWNRPDYANGIENNDKAYVSEITDAHVTLKMNDGREISYLKDQSQLSFLNHTWAQTGHAYQGQTVDHIIAAMPSISILTEQKGFYLDISRAREEITFLTDNIKRLSTVLKERTGEARSALDVAREKAAKLGFENRSNSPIEKQENGNRPPAQDQSIDRTRGISR